MVYFGSQFNFWSVIILAVLLIPFPRTLIALHISNVVVFNFSCLTHFLYIVILLYTLEALRLGGGGSRSAGQPSWLRCPVHRLSIKILKRKTVTEKVYHEQTCKIKTYTCYKQSHVTLLDTVVSNFLYFTLIQAPKNCCLLQCYLEISLFI
jgi:hypothetical protein